MPKSEVLTFTITKKLAFGVLAGGLLLGAGTLAASLAGIRAMKGHFQTLYDMDAAQTAMIGRLHAEDGGLPPPVTEPTLQEKISIFKRDLGISPEEFAVLKDSEAVINLAPETVSRKLEFKRDLSDAFMGDVKRSKNNDDPVGYYVQSKKQLKIDSSLPKAALRITDAKSLYPSFQITNLPKNSFAFFEFDTDDTFGSADLWRYPAPSPFLVDEDVVGRAGQNLFVLKLRNSRKPTADGKMTMPFRISAMALPAGGSDEFSDLAKYAQLVGYGLSHDEIINEVFQVTSQRIDQGSDTYKRTALETFKAGIAECGHFNNLAGVMLEMHSIRYRMTSGFNPMVRTYLPGAGHSGMEVLNASGTWEYFDPYLSHHTKGVAVKDLNLSEAGDLEIFATPADLIGQYGLGENVTLSDVLKYRTYFDAAGRVPLARASQFRGNESEYGRNLALRSLTKEEILIPNEDLSDTVTIYVRARYITSSKCVPDWNANCADGNAVASEWTVKSFEIEPKKLLGIQE